MPAFRIAIIGRPNVGKSSLTNMLAARKVSIVDPTPGVTRDRVTTVIPLESSKPGARDIAIELTDTGGYGIYTTEHRKIDEAGFDLSALTKDIERQIALAVKEADLVLFVVDSQTGINAQDFEVARLLRVGGLVALDRGDEDRPATKAGKATTAGKAGAPAAKSTAKRSTATASGPAVIVVANKVDGPKWEMHALDAASLGFGSPLAVSAKNNYRRREFTDALYDAVGELIGQRRRQAKEAAEAAGTLGTEVGKQVGQFETVKPPDMMLAIVGKRNAGKSTLVNTLAGQERMIVSEIPGTTRDAVDVRFEMDGKSFIAIDTAGLRRKKSFQDRIEWFALDRMQRAVERADVALLMIDATTPISHIDHQVGMMLTHSYKPVVIVINKWDLVKNRYLEKGRKAKRGESVTIEAYEAYIRRNLKGLDFAPIAFISAKETFNVAETIQLAFDLMEQARTRCSTGKLNRLVRELITRQGPSSKLGTFVKLLYTSQVDTSPPTIVCIVSKPQLFDRSYERFLINRFREELPFPEVPIRLIIRGRRPMEEVHEHPDDDTFGTLGADGAATDAALEQTARQLAQQDRQARQERLRAASTSGGFFDEPPAFIDEATGQIVHTAGGQGEGRRKGKGGKKGGETDDPTDEGGQSVPDSDPTTDSGQADDSLLDESDLLEIDGEAKYYGAKADDADLLPEDIDLEGDEDDEDDGDDTDEGEDDDDGRDFDSEADDDVIAEAPARALKPTGKRAPGQAADARAKPPGRAAAGIAGQRKKKKPRSAPAEAPTRKPAGRPAGKPGSKSTSERPRFTGKGSGKGKPSAKRGSGGQGRGGQGGNAERPSSPSRGRSGQAKNGSRGGRGPGKRR